MRRDYTIGTSIALVVALAAIIAFMLPGIRHEKGDQQCRFRLRRLGEAVHRWIDDHGRRSFPRLSNPAAGRDWTPGQAGSIDAVLWSYLQGNLPKPKHDGENQADYDARMREDSLAVCPETGFSYWFNEALLTTRPEDLATGASGAITYFQCQKRADGTWPHERKGVTGIHVVQGFGEQFQVDVSQVDALEQAYNKRLRDRPTDQDLPIIADKLKRYKTEIARARAENRALVVTEVSLRVRVEFQER
jgi:hypothetical protein